MPIDKVKVINSRNRDQEQFDMNVESIEGVGLMKPIRVNDKFLESTGKYELICGEGRLLAHKQLGKTHVRRGRDLHAERGIAAIADREHRSDETGQHGFCSRTETTARRGLGLQTNRQGGLQNGTYIRDYIRLVEQGEERLIHGVESGVFPIKFAIQVSATEDSQMQNILMDAFDRGIVTTNNFGQARRIISARAKHTKKSTVDKDYTVNQLVSDIAETTKVKTSYVREAKSKENRFMTLLSGINTLLKKNRSSQSCERRSWTNSQCCRAISI